VNSPKITDASIERVIAAVLRTGVLISGSVVFAGGVYYLARHGGETVGYRVFQGQPSVDRMVGQIVSGAIAGRAQSVIQLGMLLLIATPILRVAFSLAGFALERDRKYVAITAIVLALLLYGLISGGSH
jgi:uncharacterized membrane protein